MAKQKYPIGTKVRFIARLDNDYGKTGVIVGYHGREPAIYIPTATKHTERNYHPTLPDGTKFSWYCNWHEIEILPQKNEQLLFDFMY